MAAGITTNTDNDTGSGALSYSLAPGKPFILQEIRLHLNSASSTTEDLVITLQSSLGSAYNVVVFSQDMNGVQDLIFKPDPATIFDNEDSLLITWTNTNSCIYGLEVIYNG